MNEGEIMFVKDSGGMPNVPRFGKYYDNIHHYASCRRFNVFRYRLAPKCLVNLVLSSLQQPLRDLILLNNVYMRTPS